MTTPNCPLCGQRPIMVLAGGTQAFCGNDDCGALCWDPSISREENLRDAETIQFPAPEGGGNG